MHDCKKMVLLLTRLANNYQRLALSPERLAMLAQDWAEDLEAFPWEVVVSAVKSIRRESVYFPCSAEVVAQCRELMAQRCADTSRLALPEPKTQQEIAKGLAKADEIVKNLRNWGHICAKRTQ